MIDFNEIVKMIMDRGYKAEIREVDKDGAVREAIAILKPNKTLAPVIYLDTFDFGKFESLEAIVDEFIRITEENSLDEDFDMSIIYDWEKVKSNLHLCLGYRCNFNGAVFTKPFLSDIVQYIRIKMDNILGEEGLVATMIVTREMAQHWQESCPNANDIFAIATANAQGSYVIEDLWESMGVKPEDDMPSEMLILSNQDRHYGAGVLTCTELLNQASDKLGGTDFYILPSSTHEVLAVRLRDEVNAEKLRGLVQSVNDNELAQKEKLSYSVYFYERSSETIKQAG